MSMVMCPNCGTIFRIRNNNVEFSCPKCKSRLKIENGEVKVLN